MKLVKMEYKEQMKKKPKEKKKKLVKMEYKEQMKKKPKEKKHTFVKNKMVKRS